MDWKNLLLGAVGVIAAPYTGGASLALTSGAFAAHASKSAAETQLKAGEQAQAVNTQVRDQNLARLDPWVQSGMSGTLWN